MVFTERESVDSFLTLFKMEEGGRAKRFPASFHQQFLPLVLIIFAHSCKVSRPYLVPVLNQRT